MKTTASGALAGQSGISSWCNPTPPLHQGPGVPTKGHQAKEPCVRFDSGSQKRGATPYAAGVRPFT